MNHSWVPDVLSDFGVEVCRNCGVVSAAAEIPCKPHHTFQGVPGFPPERPALTPKQKAAEEVVAELVEALRSARRFIATALSTSIVHKSTGKGGHDGDGASWSECAGTPDWAARQLLDECDAALAKAGQQSV